MTRLALIDGPLPPGYRGLVVRESFCKSDGAPAAGAHALAMASTIRRHAPDVALINAVVFPGRLVTSVAALCEALDWVAGQGVAIVHCSFGLARASDDLAARIEALQAAGTLIVASAPARGAPVYPAALEGVISVQGDARCAPGEISHLALPTATYGACVCAPEAPDIRGASIAAAHVSGMLADGRDGSFRDPARALAARIRYHGRERRTAPTP